MTARPPALTSPAGADDALAVDLDRIARARGLTRHAEAHALLTVARDGDGREYQLRPDAAAAWRAMQAAAAADGVELQVFSAFRSIARQTELVRRKLAAGQPLDSILRLLAPPGYSEHHSGRAVDIATPGAAGLDAGFEATAAYAWLTRHAGRYGFTLSYPRDNPGGYLYEPWHWCFADEGAPPV